MHSRTARKRIYRLNVMIAPTQVREVLSSFHHRRDDNTSHMTWRVEVEGFSSSCARPSSCTPRRCRITLFAIADEPFELGPVVGLPVRADGRHLAARIGLRQTVGAGRGVGGGGVPSRLVADDVVRGGEVALAVSVGCPTGIDGPRIGSPRRARWCRDRRTGGRMPQWSRNQCPPESPCPPGPS